MHNIYVAYSRPNGWTEWEETLMDTHGKFAHFHLFLNTHLGFKYFADVLAQLNLLG